MIVRGLDSNTPPNFDEVAGRGWRFWIGYVRSDGWEVPSPPSPLLLPGQVERLGWSLTNHLAHWAAHYGIKVGAVGQNDHTLEIWAARDPRALGRENAEGWRDALRQIAGRDVDLIMAVDQRTSAKGGGKTKPIGPALAYLEGAREVLRRRLAVYGSRFTIAAASKLDLCRAGYWHSLLLDGLYDASAAEIPAPHPAAWMVQDGNADRDLTLPRFGIPHGDPPPPAYSYVGMDRAVNGRVLADLPLWLPS